MPFPGRFELLSLVKHPKETQRQMAANTVKRRACGTVGTKDIAVLAREHNNAECYCRRDSSALEGSATRCFDLLGNAPFGRMSVTASHRGDGCVLYPISAVA